MYTNNKTIDIYIPPRLRVDPSKKRINKPRILPYVFTHLSISPFHSNWTSKGLQSKPQPLHLAAEKTKKTLSPIFSIFKASKRIGTEFFRVSQSNLEPLSKKIHVKFKNVSTKCYSDIGLTITSLALNILGIALCIIKVSQSIKVRNQAKKLINNYKDFKKEAVSSGGIKRDYYGSKFAGKSMKNRAFKSLLKSSIDAFLIGGSLNSSISTIIKLFSTTVKSTSTQTGSLIMAPLGMVLSGYSFVKNIKSLFKEVKKISMVQKQILGLKQKNHLTENDTKKLKLLLYAKRKFIEKQTNHIITICLEPLKFATYALSLASVLVGPGAAVLPIISSIFLASTGIGSLTINSVLYKIRSYNKSLMKKLPSDRGYVDTPEMKNEILESLKQDKYSKYNFRNKRLENSDDWSVNELAVFFLMNSELGKDRKARKIKYKTENTLLSPVERFSREDQTKLGFLESPDHFWDQAFDSK